VKGSVEDCEGNKGKITFKWTLKDFTVRSGSYPSVLPVLLHLWGVIPFNRSVYLTVDCFSFDYFDLYDDLP
jgi:hypothetical protein